VLGVPIVSSYKYLGLTVCSSMFETYTNAVKQSHKQIARFQNNVAKASDGNAQLQAYVFSVYVENVLRYFVTPIMATNEWLVEVNPAKASKRITDLKITESTVIILKKCHGFDRNTP